MAGPSRTKLRITGLHVDVYDELGRMEKDGIVRLTRPRDTGKKRGTTLVSLIWPRQSARTTGRFFVCASSAGKQMLCESPEVL